MDVYYLSLLVEEMVLLGIDFSSQRGNHPSQNVIKVAIILKKILRNLAINQISSTNI
jgi:hypothetical protein